jgi:hypothetical protein
VNEIKIEIKNLRDDIEYFNQLLMLDDLSNYEYYKDLNNMDIIKYKSPIFSPVEKELMKKESIHKLNKNIIKCMIEDSKFKLLAKERQLKIIYNSIEILSKEDKFIIECRFFEKMKYIDIQKNYQNKFKIYLDIQTFIRRLNKSIKEMEKTIAQ